MIRCTFLLSSRERVGGLCGCIMVAVAALAGVSAGAQPNAISNGKLGAGLAGSMGETQGESRRWDASIETRLMEALHVANPRVQMMKVDTTPNRMLTTEVTVEEKTIRLDLAPYSVRAATYEVIEHRREGYVHVAPAPLNTLRGQVRDVPGSIVAGGVMPDGLYATIIMPPSGPGMDERRYWIQPASSAVPDAPAGLHVIYRNGDAMPPYATCSTKTELIPAINPTQASPFPMTDRGTGWYQCLVAVDFEFEYYRQTGSSALSQSMLNLIFNIVNVQYEREVDIRHAIGTVIVRTFQNYNPSSGSPNLRQQFQGQWNSVHGNVARDLAVMLSGGSNNGQAAENAAICNLSTAYAACGVDWPNLSYRTDLVAHEVGHCWNACHCACSNPPYTMNPLITYANRFFGSPTNECASTDVAQIVAHRNSRPPGCLDFVTGASNSPNDSCANALPIPCNSNDRNFTCTFGFSNFGASRDGPTGGCRPGDADIWYTYTAPCDGTAIFSTCANPSFDTVLFAYNTSSCTPQLSNQVACNDDDPICGSSTVSSRISFATTRATTYLIRIAGFNGATGAGMLTMNQSFCPAPANDRCVNAINVRQGENIAFSTIGATTGIVTDSGGVPIDSVLENNCNVLDDAQISNDIWFRHVVQCGGTTRFSLCGSSFDTKMAVYTACPVIDSSSLGCNDDSCGVQSSLDVTFFSSQTVLVRIGGYHGAVGTGTLRIDSLSCPVPVNDLCANAITLSGTSGSSIPGTLQGAYNDGSAACGNSFNGPDVWYLYTAPCDGTFLFSTCGTNDMGGVDAGIDTVVSFHSGCPGLLSNQLAGGCGDDNAGRCGGLDAGNFRDSHLTTTLTAGQTVTIRVATFNDVAPTRSHLCSYSFTAAGGTPGNDACAAATTIGDGSFPFCTVNASNSAELNVCRPAASDLWYRYVAPCGGSARASLCGSNYDTRLTVYGPANCSDANPVALVCSDDNGPACAGTSSSGDFTVAAGSAYLVRVSGFDLNSGGGTLTMTCSGTNAMGACCNATACSQTTQNACGGVWRGAATTCQAPGNPITCCRANYNQSGGLSVQDIFDFLAGFFGNAPAADFNGSGAISVQDIFDFLAAYFAGCA